MRGGLDLGDENRKRIAVLMADLQSEYNRKIMEGIIRQANILNYDVMAYSMFSNHDIDYPFQTGEENIFELFDPDKADGIIIYSESFRKGEVKEKITSVCRGSGLPYVEMDKYDGSEFRIWNDREIFSRLVSHMIEIHSLKKIYCLTGYKGCHQSENRLEGYRDAMRRHGIPAKRDWEFYGDFWEKSAEELAEAICFGKIEKPEAVVCANGGMAVSLTNALIERGIRVPEEIAVAGFDSYTGNALNTPTVTAMSDINYNQGIKTVCLLHKRITGEVCEQYELHIEAVETGGSCGCGESESRMFKWYRKELAKQMEYFDLLQSSNMMQQISEQENLQDFAGVLSGFTYLIRGLKELYVCICDDWDGINNTGRRGYSVNGYSENIIMFHLIGDSGGYSIMPLDKAFSDICGGKNPSAYYFVPLHFKDRRFGFAAVEFCNGQYSFDKQFWTWTDNVSVAIETIRIRNYIRRFSERIHLTAVRDPLTGIYNRRGFEELSSEMYEQAIINKEKFMMIAIDINNLSDINLELGCGFGDDIIITVANAVNSSCRGNEICCRCGDDNFYIIGSMDYKNGAAEEHIAVIKKYCASNRSFIESGMNIILDAGYYCGEVGDGLALSDIIRNLNETVKRKRMEGKRKTTYLKGFFDLRKRIYENPKKKWSVDDMAQSMALSRAYFQRLYKREFGVSVMKDVITARIALARRLLVTDRSSVAEIAVMCGYESEIYFMQQFKKETGMTPTQYRKGEL